MNVVLVLIGVDCGLHPMSSGKYEIVFVSGVPHFVIIVNFKLRVQAMAIRSFILILHTIHD